MKLGKELAEHVMDATSGATRVAERPPRDKKTIATIKWRIRTRVLQVWLVGDAFL